MTATFDIVPLRSLVAVARCGGFHRAAQALHLTQSAVSQHVRRLEQVAGGALVERSGRATVFTERGLVLLDHAVGILDAHDAAVAAMSVERPVTVTVATTEHAADLLIPALTQLLRARLPASRIHFRVDRSVRIARASDDGAVDVAVFLAAIDDGDVDVETAPIEVAWLASTEFDPAGHAEMPVVLFDAPCALRAPSTDSLASAGIPYRVTCESQDLAGVVAATRAGLGVTLLPVIEGVPDGLRIVGELPIACRFALRVRTGPGVGDDVTAAAVAAVAEISAAAPMGAAASRR